MDRNLVIGFSAAFVVVGAVAAVASGIDWDPRDVAAADRYRDQERVRAERYRAEVAGQPAPRASANADSEESARATRRAEREARRAERRAAHHEWWERALGRMGDRIDREAVEAWRERIGGLGDWWRDEAVPAWEDWAAEQEERVSEPEHFAAPSTDFLPVLPPGVERILEDSLGGEEAPAWDSEEDASDTPLQSDGEAGAWWAEERERMRSRRGHR